jgi:hypothetical protein
VTEGALRRLLGALFELDVLVHRAIDLTLGALDEVRRRA